MRTRWVGSTCAAAMALAVLVGEGVSTQSSSSSQGASGAGGAPRAEAAGQVQQKVTLEGCLSREVGPSSAGEEFVLENARVMPQNAVQASATNAESGAVGTSGAAEATSEAPSRPNTAEEPVPDPKAFRLRGARERGIGAWVGHRVSIVGVIDEEAADRRDRPAVATVNGAIPAGSATAEARDVPIAGSVTVLSLMPASKSCAADSD